MKRYVVVGLVALCAALSGCIETGSDSEATSLQLVAVDEALSPADVIRGLDRPLLTTPSKTDQPIRILPLGGPTGPGPITNATTCFVSGGPPTRSSSTTIQSSVLVNCNGPIQSAVLNLYIVRGLGGVFDLFASRSESFGQVSLFGTSASRTDAVCLPADYATVLDITVNFRDGSPRTIQSIFSSPLVPIGC